MRTMPRSLAIAFLLAAAGLTLSFQNCSSTMATALLSGGVQSTSASSVAPAASTGNGQGYDGMTAATYVSMTKAGTSCPDGTQVNAKIKVVSSKVAYTIKANCVEVSPQKISSSELQKVPGFKKYVIYKSAVYKTDATTATADLVCVPTTASTSVPSVMITPDQHAQFATSQTNSGDFVVDLASGAYVGKDSAGDAFTLAISAQGLGSLTIVPANGTQGAAVPMTCYQ